jgi:hypothetical protein
LAASGLGFIVLIAKSASPSSTMDWGATFAAPALATRPTQAKPRALTTGDISMPAKCGYFSTARPGPLSHYLHGREGCIGAGMRGCCSACRCWRRVCRVGRRKSGRTMRIWLRVCHSRFPIDLGDLSLARGVDGGLNESSAGPKASAARQIQTLDLAMSSSMTRGRASAGLLPTLSAGGDTAIRVSATTGANGRAAVLSSGSRRAWRRQLNNCCGVSPWRRATWPTLLGFGIGHGPDRSLRPDSQSSEVRMYNCYRGVNSMRLR